MSYLEDATNPFDATVQDLAPETPDGGAVLREGMRQLALGMRVALPCVVTQIRGNQLVDVQPLLLSRYVDGTTRQPPVIPHALVCAPMGAAYSVKLPIAAGDTGLALFCDRSLDAWAAGSGGAVDPADCRSHDINDAIFVPGMVPLAKQTTDQTTDLVLTNGQVSARLQADGRLALGNGQAELVDLTCQLAQSVIGLCDLIATQFFTTTALGPMPPLASTVAAADSQKATAQSILTHLQSIRGS